MSEKQRRRGLITFSMKAKVNTRKLLSMTEQESSKAIGEAALEVVREAKILVSKGSEIGEEKTGSPAGQPPYVKTGNLRSSIRAEKLGTLTWIAGASVIYGKFLEYGTRNMQARPFMRPALQNAYPRLSSLFKGLF